MQDKSLLIPHGRYVEHFHSPCEDLETPAPDVSVTVISLV
jgi:hypothetical protein